MLNFKKAGIFSRGSGQEDACEQEDQSGGVLAVWGSPGSGKTTVAVRLAKYLADKRRNVILLLCDMTAPMLPCICPAADLECERSGRRPCVGESGQEQPGHPQTPGLPHHAGDAQGRE